MSDRGEGFDYDSQMDLACELFANDSSPAFTYLRRLAETPLQVPFYYLDLIRAGSAPKEPRQGPRPSAEQVKLAYRAILQRPPESPAIIEQQIADCESLDALILMLLASREVTLRMPQLHARAFPRSTRIWHLHIPKTGGTSFFETARRVGCSYVNTNMLSGALGNLAKIADAVRLGGTPKSRVIISGHWRLPQYQDAIGPFDRVVVFVRDPVQRLVSEFNYSVDVVRGGKHVHATDPNLFLSRGLDPTSFTNTLQAGFFTSNVQSGFLSNEATCESTLHNLAACDAELLPISAVSHASASYFPGVEQRRANVSHKHLDAVEITPAVRESILATNSQDFALFQIAQSRFEADQGLSAVRPAIASQVEPSRAA